MPSNDFLQQAARWAQPRALGNPKIGAATTSRKTEHILLHNSQSSVTQQKVIKQKYKLVQAPEIDNRRNFSAFILEQKSKKKEIFININQHGFSYELNHHGYYFFCGKIIHGEIFFHQIEFTPSSESTPPTISELEPYLGKILRVIFEQGNVPYKMAIYHKLYQDNHGQWRIKQKKQNYACWFESATIPSGQYAFVKLSSENYCRVFRMKNSKSSHATLADLAPFVDYAGEVLFSEDGRGTLIEWNNQSSTYPGDQKLRHQAGLPTNLFYDHADKQRTANNFLAALIRNDIATPNVN